MRIGILITQSIPGTVIKNGKVTDIGYGMLLMSASNRLSAFDRHMCNINNKGYILNHISKWWFQNTEHIIENHYIYAEDNHMLVRKTEPIKLTKSIFHKSILSLSSLERRLPPKAITIVSCMTFNLKHLV